MPRRRPKPPEPRSPAAEALADVLHEACCAILVVLHDWAGWDQLARTVRASELALRRDVCVVIAQLTAPLTPAIEAATRACAIRTAERITDHLASAHDRGLAPPRDLHVAAFALGQLIETLREPHAAPAATAWN